MPKLMCNFLLLILVVFLMPKLYLRPAWTESMPSLIAFLQMCTGMIFLKMSPGVLRAHWTATWTGCDKGQGQGQGRGYRQWIRRGGQSAGILYRNGDRHEDARGSMIYAA